MVKNIMVIAFYRFGQRMILVTLLILAGNGGAARLCAQSIQPQKEQLLNGLRILLISRSGDPNVLLKLRIHSGAAFDTTGKSGSMSLLGELLFPDPVTFDYFKDEINGRLSVNTDFDSIDITMQGRASEYDRIVDTLRAALVTTPLTVDNVLKIKEARIKTMGAKKQTLSEVADRAIAERLFGNFPYAHNVEGTVETLGRIERADLLLARERFLNPNNATLVIIGGVDQRQAMRALRQLLGGWRKSENLVPSTFRQPEQANTRTLIANYPGAADAEVRLATRGLARGDRDYNAATLLAFIVQARWQGMMPNAKVTVTHEAHSLPGIFLMRATVENNAVSKAIDGGRTVIKALQDAPVLSGELEKAKRDLIGSQGTLPPNDKLADDLLDAETYSLPMPNESLRSLNSLSPADLQRVAIILFKESPVASVVVGDVDGLKAQIASENFEVSEPKAKVIEPALTTTKESSPRRTFTFKPKNPHPLLKSQKPKTQPD